MTEPIETAFCWTITGKTIHITDNPDYGTRCGRRFFGFASPDEVVYYGICSRCRRDG